MEKITYGIIGFGGIAENRIAKEGFCLDAKRFQPHPHAVLKGATSRTEKRKQAAESMGIEWHGSVEDLVADPEIQAVFITSNNASHAEQTTLAIKAGKHCIIDKPMATTLEDARNLQSLAREHNISLAVDHMMVYNAYNQAAQEMVQNDVLGEVNDIVLHMEFLYGSTPEEASTWRCSKPEEIGGPIGDLGSHCLYMAEFLLDSTVSDLSCTYLPETIKINVENGAFIEFVLNSGVSGSVRVSFNQPRGGVGGTLSNLGYEIYGTKGVLRGYGTLFQLSGHEDEPFKVRLEWDTFKKVEEVKTGKVRNIYQALIEPHALSILEGKPMDGQDGVHNLELVLACHESAMNQGKKITARL